MTDRPLIAVILAAGLGTRMKSTLPKVLHPLAGKPLLRHVLDLANQLTAETLAVVVGPEMADKGQDVLAAYPNVKPFVQKDRLGTAHAVMTAQDAFSHKAADVLILYGDTPLIQAETLRRLRAALTTTTPIALLGFETQSPTGYGRLVLDAAGHLAAIREEADASEAEKAITLCNSGVFFFRGEHLPDLLSAIGNQNAKGEYYLTDVVAIGREKGLATAVVTCSENEVLGINSRKQLAEAEAIVQARLREKALANGVTLLAPETVFFSMDTELAPDVVVEPFVVFGPGVQVAEGATIRAFSHLEQAQVGPGAVIGPYARLRPETRIDENARVGNFVEVKKSHVAAGAKVNHLSYIGDATIGPRANIGAGTITCNYDGFSKNPTHIGEEAFIGSNSALVAPIRIGRGAYVGSGSVVTKDVEADALAIARAKQEDRPGWAARYREIRSRGRKDKKD